MVEPVLDVQDLSVEYEAGAGTFHALTGVSVRLDPGRVVGIVGETGSGKSTLAHAIPRLLPEPPARIVSGKTTFRGVDVLDLPKWKLPLLRGTGIGIIFRDPINSLHPAHPIFDRRAEASLLIADVSTSALDITIQAQVLTLMKERMEEVQTSILFISHDLGIIAEMADEVGVLYAGHLVEFGPVEDVYANPRHPYTKL